MKKGFFVVGVVLLAGIVSFFRFFSPAKNDEAKDLSLQGDTTPASSATNNTVTAADAGSEKTISAKTHYNNPAGGDDVAFTLTVDESGVITDAKTDVLAVHGISQMRQTSFANSLPAVVKGKKLADLAPLDRVGGSSLTTGAFNSVLSEFKTKL